MKKRNLLLSLLLVLSMMLTACGEANPFVGSWKGTCDFTDFIVASVSGGDETKAAYLKDINGLEFVIDFEFTENEMSMSVDESSLGSFMNHYEAGLTGVMEAMLIDELTAYGISYEEYLGEAGQSREEVIESMIEEMDWMAQMEGMVSAMADALALEGAYMYDDGVLTIVYEDGTYEEMNYTFEGDTLTIMIVAADGTEFSIICESQK